MKIKNIYLKNNLILAPMAGVNDVGFRELCVLSGADYAVGEMISTKALKHNSQKTKQMLITSDNEKIKVAQIFGHEPQLMADVVKSEHMRKFDIIDINMGCPTRKIVANGDGCALMGNINLAQEIIEACVKATDKPITVKFRAGLDEDNINAVQFAKMCENAGAAAITVHGRTKKQGYSGVCDLNIIKQVKQAVSIPVIGNGDVVDINSYNKMLLYTNCDAVMIGRGALGNPEIFSLLTNTKPCCSKKEMIERHIKLLQNFYSDKFILKHMRKHFLWYLKGENNATLIKQQIVTINSLQKVLEVVCNFFNDK